jgi:hypothetical protein
METNKMDDGGAPDEAAAASWTNETLSMSTRRELLDREVRKVIDGHRTQGMAVDKQQAGSGQHDHPQGAS